MNKTTNFNADLAWLQSSIVILLLCQNSGGMAMILKRISVIIVIIWSVFLQILSHYFVASTRTEKNSLENLDVCGSLKFGHICGLLTSINSVFSPLRSLCEQVVCLYPVILLLAHLIVL